MTAAYVTGGTDTREVPPGSQIDLWRAHVTDNQGRIDLGFATAGSFVGGTKIQWCGGLRLVEFWSDPVTYIRGSNAADRDGDDSLRLLVPLTGEFRTSTRGVDRTLSPGFATAVSMDPGFTIENRAPARARVLTLPSTMWEGTTPINIPVWELDAGTTPAELIRRERLDTVLSRLRHPAWRSRAISHIAHASGFNSLTAFNNAFRTQYGCTPSDIRTNP